MTLRDRPSTRREGEMLDGRRLKRMWVGHLALAVLWPAVLAAVVAVNVTAFSVACALLYLAAPVVGYLYLLPRRPIPKDEPCLRSGAAWGGWHWFEFGSQPATRAWTRDPNARRGRRTPRASAARRPRGARSPGRSPQGAPVCRRGAARANLGVERAGPESTCGRRGGPRASGRVVAPSAARKKLVHLFARRDTGSAWRR